MNRNIAIIPARGGSKRLPNKNIKLLGSLPLIAHSIKFAQENGIEKIVVSTDDDAIKKIAIDYGAEVILRPAELAIDTSPTIDALKHVIQSIPEDFDTIILLQPTNPLRPKNLLEDALKIMKEQNYDSLMSVSRNHQKFGKISKNKFVPFNYEFGQRSQDLEPLFFENGLLYITNSESILNGEILAGNNFPLIVNHPYSQVDIDTEEDFKFAEYILENHPNE
jgi:CMP-N-acetylneuraminic acid synthetase|tara:strand:- start:1082 stop:1747 length:666 start_codon:yes stop_codon:yes gene_type:complete